MSILSQTRRSILSSPKLLSMVQKGFNSRHRICDYVERNNSHKLNLTTSVPIRSIGNESYSMKSICFRSFVDWSQNHHVAKGEDTNHDEHHKKRQNDNHNSRGTPIDATIFSALGILGLFRTISEDELIEERARLSDEQKIKKMKPIELLIARGVLAMCDQEYQKANSFFHDALHEAQDKEDGEQETLVLNLLAANYFESGDLEKAEKLFIDLIKRLMANGAEVTDPAILELSLKLASIYSKNPGAHEKATKGFKFVINSLLIDLQDVTVGLDEIDIQELSEEKRNSLALLGWSYDWFAKHLLALSDFNGAADMLQRALQISSKVLGPLHDQTLILFNDVGTTLAMNNSPKEGRKFIRKAVEGAIESQSQELASFYVNLGLVDLKLGKLSKAKRYCEYSIELASKNREHHSSHDVIELSRSCLNEVERLSKVNEK